MTETAPGEVIPTEPEQDLQLEAEQYEEVAGEWVDTTQGFRDRIRNFRISKGDVVQILATVGGCLLYKDHFQQQPPFADAFAIFSAAGIAGMYVDARYENADVLPQLPRRLVTGIAMAGAMAFGPGIVEGTVDKLSQIKLPDFRPQIDSIGNSFGDAINQTVQRVREDPRIVLVGIGAGTAVAGARKLQREMQEHKPIRTAVARAVAVRQGATISSDLKTLRRAGSVAREYTSYHASKLALKGFRNLSGMAARTFSRLESRMNDSLISLDTPDTAKAASND